MRKYCHSSALSLLAFCATAALNLDVCHGWSVGGGGRAPSNGVTSRRQLLQHMIAVSLATTPSLATAATTSSTSVDAGLQKIQMGHARVRYLLDHWDVVTTVCGTTVMTDLERRQVVRTEGGTQCVLTPLRVQEFMGYKSIKDPLYKADKLMLSLLKYVDPDDVDKYLDYVEQYREKADQTAMLAYTSSWGEANP